MGVLSSSVSITCYKIDGKLENPVMETMEKKLNQHIILEIDEEVSEKAIGWTSIANPYEPNFDGSSFCIGTYMVFALRIDQKSIPTKVLKKYYTLEMTKLLSESGRKYLNKTEKQMIKDRVYSILLRRYPATPKVYDLIWNYEDGVLWFFSNQKSANEELETLFSKTFQLSMIRLFPYTMADLDLDLSDMEREQVNKLSPTLFSE
ncbi:MAG: recombination-associated protein RdgC [Desulfobacterales bacterium]